MIGKASAIGFLMTVNLKAKGVVVEALLEDRKSPSKSSLGRKPKHSVDICAQAQPKLQYQPGTVNLMIFPRTIHVRLQIAALLNRLQFCKRNHLYHPYVLRLAIFQTPDLHIDRFSALALTLRVS